MASDPTTAFVWIWLPTANEPIVCGRLDTDREPYMFTYGQSYLERDAAVPIFQAELPLRRGPQTATSGTRLPLCIDDSDARLVGPPRRPVPKGDTDSRGSRSQLPAGVGVEPAGSARLPIESNRVRATRAERSDARGVATPRSMLSTAATSSWTGVSSKC